mmetsp:Transcript_40656/g.68065  ORF Transcript_40656/g.68065 Transcript_40656/m.68065 type:complete len:216 (+) Transcript_40656:206-853(+)
MDEHGTEYADLESREFNSKKPSVWEKLKNCLRNCCYTTCRLVHTILRAICRLGNSSKVWPALGGNYDINVMMIAMEEEGYRLQWFDKRNVPLKDHLNLENVLGILLNGWRQTEPGTSRRSRFMTCCKKLLCGLCCCRWREGYSISRHWSTVREVNGTFYDFDSLLKAPRKLHPESEVYKYLMESVIETSGAEMLCVYPLKLVSPFSSPTYESDRS